MFNQSDLNYTTIITTHPNHATQITQQTNASTLVSVGGDGILHEILNGVMNRPDWLHYSQTVTIGVIGAGSGNGVAKSISSASNCVHSLENSAFFILKNSQRPLDVLTCAQSNSPLRFAVLSLSWGLISDIDFESERWRFLGGARFAIGAIVVGLRRKRYSGNLQILTQQSGQGRRKCAFDYNKGDDGSKWIRCSPAGNCRKCLQSNERNELIELAAYRELISANGIEFDTAHNRSVKVLSAEQQSVNNVLPLLSEEKTKYSSLLSESSKVNNQISNGKSEDMLHAIGIEQVNESNDVWTTVPFNEFTCLWACSVSHAAVDMFVCPFGHLSDGFIDVCYLGNISFKQSFEWLLNLENGNHINQPNTDLNCYVKTKGLRLYPGNQIIKNKNNISRKLTSNNSQNHHIVSEMAVDGERMNYLPVELRCWKGILKIHGE